MSQWGKHLPHAFNFPAPQTGFGYSRFDSVFIAYSRRAPVPGRYPVGAGFPPMNQSLVPASTVLRDARKERPGRPVVMVDRLPPHSTEAECGVLGCILLNAPEAMPACAERFPSGEDVFYDLRHQTLYAAALQMFESGKPVDPLTLSESLKTAGLLERCGGVSYLTSLPDAVPSAANLGYYADIVAEKYTLRRIVQHCSNSVGGIYDLAGPVDDFLEEFERGALSIRQRGNVVEADLGKVIGQCVDDLEYAHAHPGTLNGLSTGLVDMDRVIRGMRPAQFIVIAARPSVGKTTAAMNIAEHLAVSNGLPVGVFSLEMSAKQLVFRMICSRARVDSARAEDGKLTEGEIKSLTVSAASIRKSPLCIVDAGGLTIGQIRASARRMVQRRGIKLVVIDYIQLVNSIAGRRDNRNQELTDISGGIKAMSKELDIPVLVLSQLNRASAKEKRKPILADLRECGAIEQDADIVVLLHPDDRNPGIVGADVAKNRNGPTTEVKLAFLKTITRFECAARDIPDDIEGQRRAWSSP